MEQPPADRLALLFRLSQTFNSSLDLDEVLNRVMDEVVAAVHAERGFVMLVEPDGKLAFRTARGMEQQTLISPEFQVSRSIVERVAHEGQAVLTSDAQTDERFNMRQSVMILGLRSILCVPLVIKDRIIGVIYVDNRMRAGLFSQADLELLSSIAASAASAIENARLYQLAVEKGRMERELQMARKVQAGLLPHRTPLLPGWEFAAHWQPARQVGGDYYDFILRADGKLGLVIADVSDKGMPAALFMASTRSIVRASLGQADSPAEGVAYANRLINAEAEDSMFVTLFYGELDPASSLLTYVNAGHNPPLVIAATCDGQAMRLSRTGMALGIDPETPYTQRSLYLDPNDLLVLYTDGITDATDAAGNLYGMERLLALLRRKCSSDPEEILVSLEEEIQAFSGDVTPFDDITLLLARRL